MRKLNAAKGGGYLIQSDHSVPSNVSAERYEFVLNLLVKHGGFPLRLGSWDDPSLTGSRALTSSERVLAAIAHRESDRVPVDLGSTRVRASRRWPIRGFWPRSARRTSGPASTMWSRSLPSPTIGFSTASVSMWWT